MEGHEERQEGDVKPEAIGANRGKAQKDLAEKGQYEGEAHEVDDEIDAAIQGKVREKAVLPRLEKDEAHCGARYRAGENELYAEDEDVLRETRSDQAEIEQEVRQEAEEEVEEFEGMKRIWHDVEKEEQKRADSFCEKDDCIAVEEPSLRFFREDAAKRQIAKVYGRQKREEKQEGSEDDFSFCC